MTARIDISRGALRTPGGPKKVHPPPGAAKKGINEYEMGILLIWFDDIVFNNSGLTLEFRLMAGTGRSGVEIGKLCLYMFSSLLLSDKL